MPHPIAKHAPYSVYRTSERCSSSPECPPFLPLLPASICNTPPPLRSTRTVRTFRDSFVCFRLVVPNKKKSELFHSPGHPFHHFLAILTPAISTLSFPYFRLMLLHIIILYQICIFAFIYSLIVLVRNYTHHKTRDHWGSGSS